MNVLYLTALLTSPIKFSLYFQNYALKIFERKFQGSAKNIRDRA